MPIAELRKMAAAATSDGQVSYRLSTLDGEVNMNELIGKAIRLRFTGTIRCISCGSITKKSFAQGYCYRCFISSPETEPCLLKPHLCQAHLGVARDMAYAQEHCLIDHYVYLARSGGLKVGVTRYTQIPTRWIDQGACQGLIIAQTPNRYLAGVIEVELMKHFSDKTNWRAMLTNSEPEISLLDERDRAISALNDELAQYAVADRAILNLCYPVEAYPTKVASLNFDKSPEVEGILKGIRGQYLIFEEGAVLNLRTFSGYEVELSW